MAVLYTKEKQYLPIVNQAAAKHNVPTALILAHIKQESAFNPDAQLDEKNSAGKIWDSSYGMMQLLTGTAKTIDPNVTVEKLKNPSYNIDIGTRLISKNLDRYKNSLTDAIAAYNGGSARKDSQGRYVNSKGATNVQDYVNRVVKNYNEYSQWLSNGAKTFDISTVDPILVAGFAAVLIVTVAGGYYVTRRRKRTYYRLGTR